MADALQGWWDRAWGHRKRLSRTPGRGQTLPEPILDWATQAYLFVEKRVGSAEWLPIFEQAGMLSAPPSVIRSAEGIAARSWPMLSYLEGISSERPQDVARVLRELETDNWWAISDAMELASQLPGPDGIRALLHLVHQWDKAEIKWRSPESWADTIRRLGESTQGRRVLPAVIALLAASLLGTPHAGYESATVLPAVLSALPERETGILADGLEIAIGSHAALSASEPRLIGSIWAIMQSDWGDRDSLVRIVRTWLEAAEQEAVHVGNPASAARAARLLTAESSTLKRMGIRALSLSLNVSQERLGATMLMHILRADEFQTYPIGSELGHLVERSYPVLDDEMQAGILGLIRERASAVERSHRLSAVRLLEAIQARTGPAERALLLQLRQDLGVGELLSDDQPIAEFEWVGPESPVRAADLAEMPLDDVLAWMRHVPTGGVRPHGPSAEGLARELPQLIVRRLHEFAPRLGEIVSSVPYVAVLQATVQGLSSAIEEGQSVLSPDDVAEFLRSLLARADSENLEGDPRYGIGPSWVVGSTADLLGDRADFMNGAEPGTLRHLLARCLEDPDPSPEGDAPRDETDWDPLTAGLNSVRGKGLRAVLALLATTWSSANPSPGLRTTMEGLLLDVAQGESSPSVRSWFGAYLPWLCKNWPIETPGPVQALLPAPVDAGTLASWEAVFGAYLVFRPAFVDIADLLRSEYERAIDLLPDTRFLRRNEDHLLKHLLALTISDKTGPEWLPLCLRALGQSEDDAAGGAIAGIAHAIMRDEVPPVDSLWAIVRTRLGDLGASETRNRELTALAVLVMALPSEAQPSTVLLDLLRRGANPDLQDLLQYLTREGIRGSAVGAAALRTAAESGLMKEPWSGPEEAILQAIRLFGESSPAEMRKVCDILGSQGRFFVEQEALELESREARRRKEETAAKPDT